MMDALLESDFFFFNVLISPAGFCPNSISLYPRCVELLPRGCPRIGSVVSRAPAERCGCAILTAGAQLHQDVTGLCHRENRSSR